MTSQTENKTDNFALIICTGEDCLRREPELILSRAVIVQSFWGAMCGKVPLIVGTLFGLFAQLCCTIGVISYFEHQRVESTGNWKTPTPKEWDTIVDCFAAIMYTINTLFTVVFLVGVISRIVNKHEACYRHVALSRVVMAVMSILIAVTWGAGLIMFASTALLVPQILSFHQLSLFLSLQVGYVILMVLLRTHDILMTAVECAERCENEDQDEKTRPLIKSEYAVVV